MGLDKKESGYRWIVFSAVLFAYFLIVSQRTAPGLITEQIMNDFHISASTVGMISSIQFLAYAGLQIPVGLLSDRFGPNRFLIVGTLLTGLGSLFYSIAPNEYVLITSRFIVGVGDAAIFVNLVLILNEWFKGNEFVKLMGIVALIGGIGSLSATLPFSLWITNAGWRIPFLSVSIMLILFSFVLHFVLISKSRRIFKQNTPSNPDKPVRRESVWNILRRVVTTRQAWATFLCHFGVVGTYVGFIGSWAVPYGMNVFDLTRSSASQIVMYALVGTMIGGPFLGWISSRTGQIKKTYTIVHLIVIIGWVGLFSLNTSPPFLMVLFMLFILGFGNGASALTFAIVRKSFPMEEVGVVTGFANMGGFLSAVLLPIFFGHVLDFFPKESISLGYHYGFIVPVIFSLFGLVGILLAKEEKVAGSKKVLKTS